MNQRIAKTLALAVASTAIAFASVTARANLIGDTIYGCATTNLSTDLATAASNCTTAWNGTSNPTGNIFTTNSAVVGGGIEFSGPAGKLVVSADFGDNGFTLTFQNTNASGGAAVSVPGTAGLLFVNLDLTDGTLAGITGVTGSLNGAALTPAQIAAMSFQTGFNTAGPAYLQGNYLYIDLPAFSVNAGTTASISGTFVTVPEPGSVALLGALLLALAFVRIDKVRSFGARLMGRGALSS